MVKTASAVELPDKQTDRDRRGERLCYIPTAIYLVSSIKVETSSSRVGSLRYNAFYIYTHLFFYSDIIHNYNYIYKREND